MSSLSSPLSPRALLLSAVVGIAVAGLLAVAIPSSGTAGPQVPQCHGQDADVVLSGSEDYVGDNTPEVVVATTGQASIASNTSKGSALENTIRTKGGDDVVCSREEDDVVAGGKGQDDLNGETGDDVLRGRQDDDDLDGDFEDNAKGISEEDFCLGGKPSPDTEAHHDIGVNCEHNISVFTIQG